MRALAEVRATSRTRKGIVSVGTARDVRVAIALTHGRKLSTLADAADYIASLPPAERDNADWKLAMEALTLASERSYEQLAREVMMKALDPRHPLPCTSVSTARKIFKVLCSPRLAMALLNAQLAMLGRAQAPLSERLYGRVYLKAVGEVNVGDSVCILADVVPVEIVAYKDARIFIADRTFINYGASITAYERVSIGSDCLRGHYTHRRQKRAWTCGALRRTARPTGRYRRSCLDRSERDHSSRRVDRKR
jgi:hypothetical protein